MQKRSPSVTLSLEK